MCVTLITTVFNYFSVIFFCIIRCSLCLHALQEFTMTLSTTHLFSKQGFQLARARQGKVEGTLYNIMLCL